MHSVVEPAPPTLASRYGAVALGGLVGAGLRWSQVALLDGALPGPFPWGTFAVNVVGSLAVSTFFGVVLASTGVHPLWRPLFAVGVCGAYTTLSSLSHEAYALVAAGRPGLAAGYVAASLAVGLAGARLGAWLGERRGRRRLAVGPAIASPALALVLAVALAVALATRAAPALRLEDLAAVALGGSTGALARYALVSRVSARAGPLFPWGTLVVNLTGCLAIGLFEGRAAASGGAAPALRLLLVTGWLGGFTTFSAMTLESLALARAGTHGRAATNAAGNVAGGLLAVALGHWLGGLS